MQITNKKIFMYHSTRIIPYRSRDRINDCSHTLSRYCKQKVIVGLYEVSIRHINMFYYMRIQLSLYNIYLLHIYFLKTVKLYTTAKTLMLSFVRLDNIFHSVLFSTLYIAITTLQSE